MRDMIQKIIAVENEAKAMVEAARAESDRILANARKECLDIVEKSREETNAEVERILEAAAEAAEQERKDRLARAALEIEDRIQLDPDIRKEVIEGVVRCICGLK